MHRASRCCLADRFRITCQRWDPLILDLTTRPFIITKAKSANPVTLPTDEKLHPSAHTCVAHDHGNRGGNQSAVCQLALGLPDSLLLLHCILRHNLRNYSRGKWLTKW